MPVYNYTTLDDPGATQGTFASGINDAGQIVGTYLTGTGVHGFVYSGGTFTTLDDPSGIKTFATGINSAGHIVGYYTDSGGHDHAFFFSGGFDTLNNPLGNVVGNDFYAEGINDLG
jgi:probable HAF family extracellular repeat protein